MNKIAIIGDVHAEDQRLSSVIEYLKKDNLEQILCVGDIVDGPGSVDNCCLLLSQHSIKTVIGNHDQWCLDKENRSIPNSTNLDVLSENSTEFLQSLEKVYLFETGVGRAMLCHGLGEYTMASVKPKDSEQQIFNNLELWKLYSQENLNLVLNGHSHRPGIRKFGHLNVINAGSLDEHAEPCFIIIDFSARRVDFYVVNKKLEVKRVRGENI